MQDQGTTKVGGGRGVPMNVNVFFVSVSEPHTYKLMIGESSGTFKINVLRYGRGGGMG